MTKKQLQKHLEFQSEMTAINHIWWSEQMAMTMAELEMLTSEEIMSNRKQKRLEFLEGRLSYLQNKASFENDSLRRLQKKIKKFHAVYSD